MIVTKDNIFRNRFYVVFLSVFCCFLWGSAFPVLKISYEELQLPADDIYAKMEFAGIRFLIASLLILLIYGLIQKKMPIITKKSYLSNLLVLGLFSTAIQYYFFYNGLANTTGIKGAILTSIGTFFVIVFAHFVTEDDKINLPKVLGLVAGFVGIFIVNWTKTSEQGITLDFHFRGEGFLIISGISSAIATLYGKGLAKKTKPALMNGFQMLFGSIILLLIGLIGSGGFNLHFTILAAILLIYSAFLSATAFTLWYSLLKYNKATTITIYKFLTPVFGGVLSAIFLPEEHFTIYIVIGLIFVSLGIYIVNKRKGKGSNVLLKNLKWINR